MCRIPVESPHLFRRNSIESLLSLLESYFFLSESHGIQQFFPRNPNGIRHLFLESNVIYATVLEVVGRVVPFLKLPMYISFQIYVSKMSMFARCFEQKFP